MGKIVGLAIVAGGVALAVVIGQKMSTDAMAVVIGVAVGVVASIPTSLLVMAAMRRGQQPYTPPPREFDYERPRNSQPQIYIVQPGQQPGLLGGQQQSQLPPPWGAQAPSRRYRVVDDDGESEIDTSEW